MFGLSDRDEDNRAAHDAKQNQETIGVSESMIEQVARAMCEAEWGKGSWLLVSDHSRNKAMRHARAAIEAMLTPTDAMVDAYDNMDVWDDDSTEPTAQQAMSAMIDAALNEQVVG